MLEEMPPFPERESSILAKLKKKKGPNTVTDLEETKKERSSDINGSTEATLVNASTAVGFCCSRGGGNIIPRVLLLQPYFNIFITIF